MPDSTSDAVDGVTLQGEVATWLDDHAEELGLSEEELLERLVAAYRRVTDEEPGVVTDEEFEERLDDVTAEFDEKIQDVRERVIQVKREADGKAPADHDHPELAERVDAAAEAAKALESDHESLADRVEELADRVDAGFENYEEVLTYLRDEVDDLDRKTTTLATAVLSMRESLASLAAAEGLRERTEELQREANLAGVRVADCGDCGQAVTVALLTAPECPFCGATFEGVEPKTSWFGSATLLTGSAPALESGESFLEGDESLAGEETVSLEEIAESREESGDELDVGVGDDTAEDDFTWQGGDGDA